MTQVLDASVVVSMLLDSAPVAGWCEDRYFEDALAAPHHMPVEAANIIRRSETRGVIDRTTANAALQDLLQLRVELLTFEELAERAWELRSNLTVYDACYVAAAELVSGRLVTLDRRLSRAPGIRCPVLVAP